jgi:hypothetical protein
VTVAAAAIKPETSRLERNKMAYFPIAFIFMICPTYPSRSISPPLQIQYLNQQMLCLDFKLCPLRLKL